MEVTLDDLYLAYRQAKIGLYFETRGIGLAQLAEFENDLPANLNRLRRRLSRADWFDGVELGELWIAPKRLRRDERASEEAVVCVGTPQFSAPPSLDVQFRCVPTPEFAVVEVLFLWRFGPMLDRFLSKNVVGYRLHLPRGRLRKSSRWVFEYWRPKYASFRTAPLDVADRELSAPGKSVVVVSADLTSYYDTIDPAFLLSDSVVEQVAAASAGATALREYQKAASSLLRVYAGFRERTAAITGLPWSCGIPIGPLTSRLVANLALATLDTSIEQSEDLLCYRRYVDDMVAVVGADPDDSVEFREIVRSLFPIAVEADHDLTLDVDRLNRRGCEFTLQKRKIRVHHLTGKSGRAFVDAVATDLGELVSERRAFLDQSVLTEPSPMRPLRADPRDGSRLRVLRDADRLRLKRFELGTKLNSLERISQLLDGSEARGQIAATIQDVLRGLDSEGSWFENVDLVHRLLRLALSVREETSARELIARTDALWGSIDELRASVGELFYRDKPIRGWRSWVWLRNYLHERRVAAVVDSVPSDSTPADLSDFVGSGLRCRTTRVGPRALIRRSRLLAASDLRMRDREDDRFLRNPSDSHNFLWVRRALGSESSLASRFDAIETFVSRLPRTDPWRISPARLFLCTRPPTYFDIARRYLAEVESTGFADDVFSALLETVNAIRGTFYRDPIGDVVDPATVVIPRTCSGPEGERPGEPNPRLILGNLVSRDEHWYGAVKRRPVLDRSRLQGLARVLAKAELASRQSDSGDGIPPSLLVLPELGIPRDWFRAVAKYVVEHNSHGLIAGLEYEHTAKGIVENQVHTVLPGPYRVAATWGWTKRFPAREEGESLQSNRLRFSGLGGATSTRPRTVVRSAFGDISVLICSELLEANRIADLLGRVELVLVPSWNPDTASYDHLIQSVGMHLNAIVAVANNGHYSDCRAWAPKTVRWRRDLCRLVERDTDSVVSVEIPLASLRKFRATGGPLASREAKDDPPWRPLPPHWPGERSK